MWVLLEKQANSYVQFECNSSCNLVLFNGYAIDFSEIESDREY